MTDPATRRGPGRPVTTGTAPVRTLRAGQEWDLAAEIAAARGETVPEVVRRKLREYVAEHRDTVQPEPAAGRCRVCRGAVPATPDPKIARSRQQVVCSRTCERRMMRQRQYDRHEPVCEQRDQYATRADAEQAANPGESTYRCSWCRCWHRRPAGAEM